MKSHSDAWIGQISRRKKWQIDDSLDEQFGVKPKGDPGDDYRVVPTVGKNSLVTKWKTLCTRYFGKSYKSHTTPISRIHAADGWLRDVNF